MVTDQVSQNLLQNTIKICVEGGGKSLLNIKNEKRLISVENVTWIGRATFVEELPNGETVLWGSKKSKTHHKDDFHWM